MGSIIFDDKGNPVCYFSPEVISIVYAYTSANLDPIPHVKLRLNLGNCNYSKDFTVPLSLIDEIKWQDKDIRCRFNPEMSPGKIQRYLADAIRSELPSAPTEKQFMIDRVGVHEIEGEKVFCTGGGIIRPPASSTGQASIVTKTLPYSLDIDQNITESEAVANMLELVSLTPNSGKIILAHVISSITRHVYKEVWKPPCFCVFLYGATGKQKTTTSANIVQIYNRSKGIENPVRLNASIPAAVEILKETNDCVAIIDDLFPAESNQIRGKQEETLIEITRFIADGTLPARMRGNRMEKRAPNCSVLFTGEYLIGKGSDAARLLPVEHPQSPDSEKLKYFQDHPLIVSTFYYFFIQWFIDNYNDIKELLAKWLVAYRKTSYGVHDRLKETHYFLNTSYSLLLQYCFDKELISEQDAKNFHHSFLGLLTALVQTQNERVKQNKASEPEEIDYLSRISALYKGNRFTIADNKELYNDILHDGLLHNNCLWLRGKSLRKHFPSTALDDLTNYLLTQGALKRSKNSRTNQISSLKGKRFYAIPLDRL